MSENQRSDKFQFVSEEFSNSRNSWFVKESSQNAVMSSGENSDGGPSPKARTENFAFTVAETENLPTSTAETCRIYGNYLVNCSNVKQLALIIVRLLNCIFFCYGFYLSAIGDHGCIVLLFDLFLLIHFFYSLTKFKNTTAKVGMMVILFVKLVYDIINYI